VNFGGTAKVCLLVPYELADSLLIRSVVGRVVVSQPLRLDHCGNTFYGGMISEVHRVPMSLFL